MGNHSLSVSRCGIYIGLFGIIEMNERIKQLAKEAAREMNETGTYSEPKFQEKFAELIVEECAIVIERNLFQGIGWNTSRAVKRHFGIDNDD
jgi:hypothetical protein